jgi:protein TonB
VTGSRARRPAALVALALALSAPAPRARAEPPPAGPAPDPRAVDLVPEGPSAQERLAEIARRVQAAARYPELARLREAEGEALVAFEIDARGRPLDLRTERSSGHGALDRAALEAVERAAPLPWVFGRIEVPVAFALRDPARASEAP